MSPVRELPRVTINGRDYFSDLRLQEFRAVDDPHTRLPWAPFNSKTDEPAREEKGPEKDRDRNA